RVEAGEYAKNAMIAFVSVPFQQRGEHRYLFSVMSSRPRVWREDEIELVREVAHRLFPRLDRARAEEAVRATELRLAAVFEALPVGVGFTDTEGQLVVSNREMQRWIASGVIPSRESTAESSRWRAWHSDGRPVEPQDYPAARAFRGEKVIPGMEMLFTDDGGNQLWAQVAAESMKDAQGRVTGQVVVITNIDAIKRTEAALRESQQRLQTVTNLVPDLLWSSDAAAMTDWCNDRWLDYTGQTFESACGHGWLDVIHPDERDASRAQFEAAMRDGEPLRLEHRMRNFMGDHRWFLVQAEPLRDSNGQVVRWFGAATDIHEQRIARDELEERVQARTRELAVLSEQRQHLLERLVAGIEEERRRIARELHDEMGQHLTALRVLLHTVRPAGDVGGHLKSIVDRLDQSVDRLTLALRPAALDHLGLHAAITSLAEEFSTASGVRVDVHLPGVEDERFADGIETAIYRVVQEALTNVWKHSNAKTASVIVERDGDALRMIVEDDGCGFDGETVFDGEAARGRFGVLGMRERLAILGGAMHIESQAGSGTTIYVRVPLASPPAA
ncbi:MAG TPA: PAS domain S-box protein, partial [Thermoanaerobaculia bacterium]|nr:PAS domain S-box protein [Thermoanaerobaculia bacterium]